MLFDYMKAQYGGKKAFLRYWYHAVLNLLFGRYRQYGKMPKDIKRIVFVCKGNICRSALAEWVFKSQSDIPCCSLGVDTTSGEDANERISSLAKAIGFNLSEHKTTAIKDFVVEQGDLYVCMEPAHLDPLTTQLSTNKVFLLGLLENTKGVYIHDPYAACDEYARNCVKNIVTLASQLAAEAKRNV